MDRLYLPPISSMLKSVIVSLDLRIEHPVSTYRQWRDSFTGVTEKTGRKTLKPSISNLMYDAALVQHR